MLTIHPRYSWPKRRRGSLFKWSSQTCRLAQNEDSRTSAYTYMQPLMCKLILFFVRVRFFLFSISSILSNACRQPKTNSRIRANVWYWIFWHSIWFAPNLYPHSLLTTPSQNYMIIAQLLHIRCTLGSYRQGRASTGVISMAGPAIQLLSFWQLSGMLYMAGTRQWRPYTSTFATLYVVHQLFCVHNFDHRHFSRKLLLLIQLKSG